MINPWLEVPLADYEGHMSAPAVGQLTALSEIFGEFLDERRPRSVAVLGVAGGNGLERIDANRVERVLGFDCHPEYLEAVRARYPALPGLELRRIDLAAETVDCASVDLVHAALIFEHAGIKRCLDNAIRLLAPEGALSVVLQLPSSQAKAVSSTAFRSIASLAGHFAFVSPLLLRQAIAARGLELARLGRRELPSGKAFWTGLFVRASRAVAGDLPG